MPESEVLLSGFGFDRVGRNRVGRVCDVANSLSLLFSRSLNERHEQGSRVATVPQHSTVLPLLNSGPVEFKYQETIDHSIAVESF